MNTYRELNETNAGVGDDLPCRWMSGVVIRMTEDGAGVLKESVSQDLFFFTFDKIPGYLGEPMGELPFQQGSTVTFAVLGERVVRVETHARAV